MALTVPVATKRSGSRASRRAVALLLPLIVLLLSVAWYVAARLALSGATTVEDAREMALASELLNDRIELAEQRLRLEVDLLTQDPRLKTLLGSPDADAETVQQVLEDITSPLEPDLLALLSPEARVQVVVKEAALADLDLGSSSVIRRAQTSTGAVSFVWGLGGRLIAVGASALRFGRTSVGILVLGVSIGDQALSSIYRRTHTSGAIVVSNRILAAAPATERQALEAAAALGPGVDQTISLSSGAVVRVRSEELPDVVVPARVVWIRPAEEASLSFERLLRLLLIPALAATALGLYVSWRADSTQPK
jgi:hypothetical protein